MFQGQLFQVATQTQEHDSKAARLPLLECFEGDQLKFRGFLHQCQMQFQFTPHHYLTDTTKVGLIVSLLSVDALSWVSLYLENSEPILNNLSQFLVAMKLMFDDPNQRFTAETDLLHLHQGKRPVIECLVDYIKDELVQDKTPVVLADLIKLCIQFDRRFQERRAEKQGLRPSYVPLIPHKQRRRKLGLCLY
ncbi:hypothetical protein XELAEV_18002157mg [Xenopus laevis]|uniref:DUF4939 domain-containing protein n=1 Tax=Xenopus laevis TaxID=8355 RepID=A0A974BQ94_XENLA|nr:hypothetical protein XELAEV_18002157mg [Xenopus laevis]